MLCAELHAGERQIQSWLDGRAEIPDWALELLTERVLDDDIARAHEDRRAQPRHLVR